MLNKKSLLIIVSGLISLAFVVTFAQITNAVTASGWKAGRIIDDALFIDANSMSVTQIQTFLNSKVPVCDTMGTNGSTSTSRRDYVISLGYDVPLTCLRDFYEVPKTVPGPSIPANNYGGKPIPTGAKSAAQLIWDAAQANDISPKVLLVKLGTESDGPLTSDDWPLLSQYTYAMGAHCPDSGPGGSANCNTDYSGFSIQMAEAAKLLRGYLDNMTQPYWPYKKPYQINSIYWNVVPSGCGASNVFIENKATAALYTYTPYQPNLAALNNMYGEGDGCSAYGNRNFWRTYNDWFGNTTLPVAVKSASSPTVYIQSNNYKFYVSSMALLQDYGINPGSIKTIPDSTLNSIPSPDLSSGFSQSLGYLVKSESDTDNDLGSVYLISLGKRYKVQSTQQLADFGFSSDQITVLPYGFIYSIDDGGVLSSFISTTTNNVFSVSAGKKSIIFSGALYNSLNTTGKSSRLSKTTAGLILSGKPISDKPLLIKQQTTAVSLYTGETYYPIPSMQVYNCWGFNNIQNISLYAIADDSYVGDFGNSQPLNCLVTTAGTTSQTLLLNGPNTYNIPSDYNISGQTLDANTSAVAKKLTPLRDLSRLIKTKTSATVWYIEDGKKRPIPSYQNLLLLGYPGTPIDIVDNTVIDPITIGSIKLGNGQIVKSAGNQALYSISNNKRTPYGSAELYLAYGNKWSDIETYDVPILDSNYPVNSYAISRYLTTEKTNTNYLVDSQGCKIITDTGLLSYAQTKSLLPIYSFALYPKLNISACQPLLRYVKSQDSSTVYYIENGTKKPFGNWANLIEHSGNNIQISVISKSTLDLIPTSASI